MGTLISVIAAVFAFICGVWWGKRRNEIPVKEPNCPFKHACIDYDSVETKQAVKRVLTLLLANDVPKKEIKEIIKQSL